MKLERFLGAVTRGPRENRTLALIFTGGDYGEGVTDVLDALQLAKVPGSFFFTGNFLKPPEHRTAIQRAIHAGHYIGPHSYDHLLYCPWDDRDKTLVSRTGFRDDLNKNIRALAEIGVSPAQITWWIPPYEWYNETIAKWAAEMGRPLFTFTPGTLSHADYTEDGAANYRSSAAIYHSILDYEEAEPDGLNGFLLLTHVGAGPRRTDKFFRLLPILISELKERGYAFARVDELLNE